MAIATTNVKISDIATEIGVTNTNFSLGDRSRRLWKNGPTDYASYKETRYYGSNCQFSTVVAAQGSALQNSTSPYAYIDASGMNAKPCGMGEWKGYDHEIRSTIGRFRVGTDLNSMHHGNVAHQEGENPSPLNDVVLHCGTHSYTHSNTNQHNSVTAFCGAAVYAEKVSGVVYIKISDVYGPWHNTSAGYVAVNLQQVGPDSGTSGTAGNGAGQTTTADTQTGYISSSNITLLKITGATRITGCKVTSQGGLPVGQAGDLPSDRELAGGEFSGTKIMTVDHDPGITTGATSTTNFGATKIGYDLCNGGSYFGDPDYGQNDAVFGVEFNFYATNNIQSAAGHDDYATGQLEILDSNPLGPEQEDEELGNGVDEDKPWRSHKITVYVSLFAYGEHEYLGNNGY